MNILYCGPPASGKTTALLNEFKHRDNVVVFTDYVDNWTPYRKNGNFTVLRENELCCSLVTEIQHRSTPTTLILDGCDEMMQDDFIKSLIQNLVCNGRHHGISLAMTTQDEKSLPPSVRANCNVRKFPHNRHNHHSRL